MAKSSDKKKRKNAAMEDERDDSVVKKQKGKKLNVKIQAIGENPEQKSSPIVAYFSSGYDPLKGSNNPDSSVKVYKSISSRNPKNPRMQLVVGANGSHLNFVGTNYSGEATAPQLCNYALGVLDKETGVLKMVPIAANRILRLSPKLRGSELSENELEDEAKKEMTKEEKEDKLRELAKYSTKKNINRDMKRETLRRTEDIGSQKDIDLKLEGTTVKSEALASTTTAFAVNLQIPPYDLDATTPDMAYPLDKIIQKGEWDYLLDIFELAQRGGEAKPDDYPSFVCNRIYKLEDIEDESRRRKIAGVLSYLTHLIKFKDKHSMNGVSSAKRHRFPNVLLEKFSSLFGTKSERRIPDDKLKLLTNYILVLSLIADDFRSDPTDITKDLGMNTMILREYYGYLGCKFVRENQVTLATLPVPLKLEPMKKRRRRG